MTTNNTENTQAQQNVTAAVTAAKSFWQQVLDAQVAGFETAVGQLEQLSQRGLTRVQGNVDQAVRLTQTAMGWFSELQAELTKSALQAARAAASYVPKATV